MDGDRHPEGTRPPGSHPMGLRTLEARMVASGVRGDRAVRLHIDPMHISAATGIWRSVAPDRCRNLLLRGEIALETLADGVSRELGRLRTRSRVEFGLEIDTRGLKRRGEPLPGPIVLNDDEFDWIAESLTWVSLEAVRIEGPVDPGDVMAMEAMVARGRPSMEGDIRAVASLSLDERGTLAFAARSQRPALRLVAEDLALYLAAVLRRDPDDIPRPPAPLVHRLLDATGTIAIRPAETEVYPGSVDVGVATGGVEGGPATFGLIYDIPSASWHADAA
ncbi:MAG: hypothetical protein ACO3QA_02710 [Phycisphaerales bacterium]|jgi:hypothetical protein